MEVSLHANMCDMSTEHISKVLHLPFKELSERLKGDYGGVIEHLWIDFELISSHAKPNEKPRWPFRFQKRVSGRSHYGLPPSPDKFNVGHYSVRPDFQLITSLPNEKLIPYVLSLIYDSTSVLLEKEKKLGGFNATLFRSNLLNACRSIGYEIKSNSL